MQKNNTTLLQTLYETCKQMGLVETQYEFSELCGRQTSWLSANKARDLPISTAAAYTLSVRLKEAAQSDLPRKLRPSANELSSMLLTLINDRARKQRENQ